MATNLWIPFSLQLDAGGNGTAEVGAPAMGYNWQAFVTFGTAPTGQSFTVSVLGQVVASGGRQSGPFAAGSGNTVTVTVSGGPASSTVNGVVQGAINQGVAAQAPLPSSGSTIEVSGGTVNINGGKITIQAGQNGVNVSIDSPPVLLGVISVSPGGNSGTLKVTPSASATGVRVFLLPNGSATFSPTVTVTDDAGYVYYAHTYGTNEGGPVSFSVMASDPLTIALTDWPNSLLDPIDAVTVWELDASGIMAVDGSQYNPLPVVDQASGSFYVQATLAAAGIIGTITGVAGRAIKIRKLHWLQSANVGMQLLDGSTPIDQLSAAISVTSPDFDYEGQAITEGNSLNFYGLGAATFIVHCGYDQN